MWSLTLSVKHRLKVSENGVLRKIFGPNTDEVTGEWRGLHNEELYVLYSSPNIIRVIKQQTVRRAVHVARMGERGGAYRILVGKPERKRLRGSPMLRRDDNINMDFQDVTWRYELD
jgi:hypothetical protein